MSKLISSTLVAAAVALCVFPAVAQQAYKQVDEKGNVTYSQTPPVKGKDAKKVDISPAQAGRGGPVGSTDIYGNQRPYYYQQPNQQPNQQAYQKQREEAEQKRIAELKADCNRNRGTDCNNPEYLRLMEAQKIPGGRAYPSR